MTARSHDRGHEIVYAEPLKEWRYTDGGIIRPRPCKFCEKHSVMVTVKIAADLSDSGKVEIEDKLVDACIAPIVKALQEGGIDMRYSCCGHGVRDGEIQLQDGRTLIIKRKKK